MINDKMKLVMNHVFAQLVKNVTPDFQTQKIM